MRVLLDLAILPHVRMLTESHADALSMNLYQTGHSKMKASLIRTFWAALAAVLLVLLTAGSSNAVSSSTDATKPKPTPAASNITIPHNTTLITPNSVAQTLATGRYGCWKTCTSTSCSDSGKFCYSSADCKAWCLNCRSCWAWGCGWFDFFWDCGYNCGKCGGSCSRNDAYYCKSTYSCWGQCAAKNKGAGCAANYECKSGKCKSKKCQ